MGVQQLVLLVMVFFSFSSPATFAPVSKNLVSENAHENMGVNGINNISTTGGGSGMVNRSKHTTSIRGGGGGGHSSRGGSQSSSFPQGGNGVVPVYAAGAAGQRKNHKGAARTCSPYWKGGFAILVAIASTSLLVYIRM